MQRPDSVIASIAVGVVVFLAIAVAFNDTNSSLSSLSSQNSGLNGQIVGLNQQLANDYRQLSSVNQQLSGLSTLSEQNANLGNQVGGLSEALSSANGQISTLNQEVSSLAQQTLTVVTVSNTIVYVQTTSVSVTSTVTSISAVPQASLVIIANTYNSANKTFTFQVQNTEGFTIYAQESASIWGQSSFGCNGQAGTFISQVYTFKPMVVTTVQLNLALGSYAGFCGGNPVTSIDLNLVIPQSTPVSPTYTFIVVPNFTHP